MEGDVLDLLSNAKQQISKLFGFHYLQKLAESNKYAKIALDVLKFYDDYLSVFNSIFKVMDLCKYMLREGIMDTRNEKLSKRRWKRAT